MLAELWRVVADDVIIGGGVVFALATIVQYLIRPCYRFFKRLETTMTFCEEQLRPNGGTSLRDAVDKLVHRTDTIEAILANRKDGF